jgi:hypothetical protein
VKVAVEAPDGPLRLFMQKPRTERHLLTTVRDGSIRVPVLILAGRTTKLPSHAMLVTWVPSSGEMEIIEMAGGLITEKVKGCLSDILGAMQSP